MHGIVILPDDEKTVFGRAGRASVQVRSNAGYFVRALEEALPAESNTRSASPSIRRAIRVLNLAEIDANPIAKLVLAVSTIEGLATEPPWTNGQQQLIADAVGWLKSAAGSREETEQVIEALQRVRKESIRQRIRKLLASHELSSMWRNWDKLYEKRSGLFHGPSQNRQRSTEAVTWRSPHYPGSGRKRSSCAQELSSRWLSEKGSRFPAAPTCISELISNRNTLVTVRHRGRLDGPTGKHPVREAGWWVG